MATMVKEKPRARKKTKEKSVTKTEVHSDVPSIANLSISEETESLTEASTSKDIVEETSSFSVSVNQERIVRTKTEVIQDEPILETAQRSESPSTMVSETSDNSQLTTQTISVGESVRTSQNEPKNQSESHAYKDISHRLDIVTLRDIPTNTNVPIEELESKLEASSSYINKTIEPTQSTEESAQEISVDSDRVENAMPSAPVFEEELNTETPVEALEVLQDVRPKVQCMPLEVAMEVCGGKEMAEVRHMSEREEAIVEAGPRTGPEHPLVDLLSTFRCSVTALEQERHKVMDSYSAEEKSREALWKVEKHTVSVSEECKCGLTVYFKGRYDRAELMKSKLPAAQLRLEGLLKDVQESYCHYQHTALLAYYQIEEFIAETLQASKAEIREAIMLVLQELRMSVAAPPLLCGALRRWARALCGAAQDARDPRAVLFLIHQLTRQSRSVSWAAGLIHVPIVDFSDAARALAVLDLLLAGPALETARECSEENEEMWEEVDRHGGGGLVSEGALRERDLLALLRGFPLRALLAALLLLARADITQTRPYEWQHSARSVLRALCGARALLATLRRARAAHKHYPRLRAALAAVARATLHAAAALHEHNKDSYSRDMVEPIEAELEALFAEGAATIPAGCAPPALLRPAARAAYCVALMTRLHDKSPLVLDAPPVELPAMPCEQHVRVAAQAAVDCGDHELARMVLDFLVKTAVKRKSVCGGLCAGAARDSLPRLLRAHDYLFATALHTVAELHQVEPLQPAADTLKFLSLQGWRPSTGEARAVLEDWSQRCPQLLQYLLHGVSYTPYDGLSLEAQLTVGAWLCQLPAPAPEWAWAVLTKLRVHRSSWRLPLDAPPPSQPSGLFAEAYAVLSSSWGHSVPEICEYGVSALCRVAGERATVAAHALPLVMAAMAASPESVSLTPQFGKLIVSLLAPAQSLVQWAWGCRAAAPELLLRRMLLQLQTSQHREAVASAWLRGLCDPRLPGPRLRVRDAALLAARRTTTLQEAPKPEFLYHLLRNVQHAPLSVEVALRATHAERELSTQLYAKLLHALDAQRASKLRIHVDNALKLIGSSTGSEDLVIYQTAAALLAAPAPHPATLALWRLLMHLYLHTATTSPMPIGLLFFSGLIKSRTLAQLKKRLQEHIVYHHNQTEAFKTLLNTRPEPKPDTSSAGTPDTVPVTGMLPPTSISKFTGTDSDSSDSDVIDESGNDDDDYDQPDDNSASESEERRRVNFNMMQYHEGAEKMLKEYSCWLDAGERLRASPHHADIARFIPDPVLNTAWSEQLDSLRPPPSPEDDDLRPPRQPSAPAPPPTPLQTAVKWILKIRDRSHRRSQAPVITSPVDDVSFSNQRQLYCLVDKHLAEIEAFARQWSSDVSSVANLDSKLWQLVGALRVRVPLAPVARSCANKCAPVTLSLQGFHEWRISEGATAGVKHNRAAARKAIAALCRARPQQARTVAALTTIARRLRSQEAAIGVADRAWACAGALPECPPAAAALTALVDELADRWFACDDEAVSALVGRWCAATAPAQHALCAPLLARAGRGRRVRVYAALLRALPAAARRAPPRAFSQLSKMDVSHWEANEVQRAEALQALTAAALAWGRHPDPQLHMLLELIGVHLVALTNATQLPLVVLHAARAAAAGRAPPALLASVARSAACAAQLPFDQLGNLLRELGVIWWEARSLAGDAPWHVEYAPHVAALQHALLRAFVATACMLSYTPERVSWYAWPALQESWGAWVAPHPARPPLLPARGGPDHPAMLKRFVDCIHQIMLDCPDCEEHLLSQVWEWAVRTHLNVTSVTTCHDSRVQLSDLLAELGALPWREHQWLHGNCLPAALQIATTSDMEMKTWVADTLRGVEAATWLRGVGDCDVAPRLAALLQLFAGPLQLHEDTLEQATLLPWARLPELALEQILERFFVEHHNPLLPYHATAQFRVILAASGLSPVPPAFSASRGKRACAVSRWTRAACAPSLQEHVPAQARALLAILAALEPYAEESSDELEELLGRAIVVMCLEPAAAGALPVWREWVSGASGRLAAGCVSAARALTSLEYFAPFADAAVAAHMARGGSWQAAAERLRGGAWAAPGPLLARAPHAAYALALAAPAHWSPKDLHYGDHELIASVWICALCRMALAGGGGGGGEGGAARAQLAKGAEPPRAAILRAVMRTSDETTHKQRLLCRLALCIITPHSDPLIRAYEASYSLVLGANPEAQAWGRDPAVKHLPMLALILYPAHENYFAEELKMVEAV